MKEGLCLLKKKKKDPMSQTANPNLDVKLAAPC